MKRVMIAVIATGLGLAPVAARTPMYANKVGVTEAMLNADEGACITDARAAAKDGAFRQPYMHNPVTDGTVGGAAGSALVRGFAEGMAQAKRFNTTLYDCMTARGYTMRRASREDWTVVKKLPVAERNGRMLQWRTAEPIHPEVPRDKID